MQLGKSVPPRYTSCSIYYLPDEQQQYLTLNRIIISRDGKENHDAVVLNLAITNEQAQELLEAFETKPSSSGWFPNIQNIFGNGNMWASIITRSV
jgi:hypothetical protein